MKILIAPDKFKGSLTAQQVCEAICDGIYAERSDCSVASLPLADGGDGTVDVLMSIMKGTRITVRVHDPLNRIIEASYGLSGDKTTAFIEMAAASGLALLKKEERNPMKTSTYGTGELIAHALDAGVENIVMGIGGSATNDGGMGMAAALGVRFLSTAGSKLIPKGENLNSIQGIDLSLAHRALETTSFTVLCDVDNPLYGPKGAAFVYAPQKGATPSTVKNLDEGLKRLARTIENTFRVDANFPGAGAGGGLPAMLRAVANVKILRGMQYMIEAADVEKKIIDADLVITGEGTLDEQTFSGKVAHAVALLTKKHAKKLWIVTGKCSLNGEQRSRLGADKIFALTDFATSEDDSMKNASALLKRCVGAAITSFF